MVKHKCGALVVTCIDFRIQSFVNDWIKDHVGEGNFDRVSLAGGVFDREVIASQVDTAKRLHDIDKVILMNHEDCGAYGEGGTTERHTEDLDKAKKALKKKYPEVEVETYIVQLNGQVSEV